MVKRFIEPHKKCPKCAKINSKLTRRNKCTKINAISSNSLWDGVHTGNKLRAKHVTFEKLANVL